MGTRVRVCVCVRALSTPWKTLGGRLNGQVSEELSGKNRGILGCPPALGDKLVNGRKVTGGDGSSLGETWAPGKLITSRGTSLI